LESIQAENDILVAKHSKHALELQEELINLPSTADVSKKQLLVMCVSLYIVYMLHCVSKTAPTLACYNFSVN